MLEAEQQTNSIQDPLEWVPTTAINWVYDRELSVRAETDFPSVICEQLNNEPPLCR